MKISYQLQRVDRKDPVTTPTSIHTMTSNSKTAPIGTYGGIPDPETGAVETTVLTPGSSKTWAGFGITLVHVATWLAAMFMILLWANPALDSLGNATVNAKNLSVWYGYFIIGILLMAVAHAALCKREEPFSASIATVVLLTLLALENCFGCAYLAYSLTVADEPLYMAVFTSQVFVSLGSGMMVSFLLNWSHNGNLVERIKLPTTGSM